MIHGEVRLRIDHAAMRAQVGNLTAEALRKAGEISRKRYSDNIRAAGRVDSGEMADSVEVRDVPGRDPLSPAVAIGTPVPYAKYQEYGTRAHGPVNAKVLRFRPKGAKGFVFAKWVRGVTPAKFAQKTLDEIRPSDFL